MAASNDVASLASSVYGYDYIFVNEPDDGLKCLICFGVAKNPMQHEACGRLFCKECLETHGVDKPCPNCRIEGSRFYMDNRSHRVIRALCVKCGNVNGKCEWEGALSVVEEHVAVCEFTLLPCPRQCRGDNGIVNEYMRKDLDEHLQRDCPNRDYECERCEVKGTYATITQLHDGLCPKKVIPCPNVECTFTMQRQNVDSHLEECEYSVALCKYNELGCNVIAKRQDMAAHEYDDNLHLHMALDAAACEHRERVHLQDKVVTLEMNLHSKIEAFESSNENIKRALILLQRKEMDLQETISELENDHDQQYASKFRITQFRKKKNTDAEFIPAYFYASPPNQVGYHMSVEVHPNGDDESCGTHISVFVRLVEGKYDGVLEWPFVGEVTIVLLNQLEDNNHFSKTLDFSAECGVSWGYTKYISHSQLQRNPVNNTQYLMHDSVYFRLSVKTSSNKPWLM